MSNVETPLLPLTIKEGFRKIISYYIAERFLLDNKQFIQKIIMPDLIVYDYNKR